MRNRKAIGIDLGGTNIRVALVSGEGEVLRKIKEPSEGDVFRVIEQSLESLIGNGVEGIGVGVAGLVDRQGARVIASPNLGTVVDRSFRELGRGLPVVVENDASAAAFGEKWMGAGREYENFVLLTLGTGIGGAIVQGGRLLPVAAEFGHMSIDSDGQKCPCGNHGCLEMYSSARAITGAAVSALEQGAHSILRDVKQGSIYRITPEDINAAAFEGDNLARDVLKRAGRFLGVGIANVINIMSPDAVILSGGLIGAWEIYIDEAIKEASRRSFKGLYERVKILPSVLGGDDAGVLGAAGLVLHGNR